MIKRLRLSHWRAFDAIEVDLDPGTTFVVAPNGVGKTSLLLGIVWAIFGDDAPLDARECIRAGADVAEAEVVLALDDDQELTLRRRVARRGRPTSDHHLDGAPIDDDQVRELLRATYRADPSVAAQLSFMVGGGHVASQRALDLKDHLYHAFGITGLRATADVAARLAKAAVKKREGVRSVARQEYADRVGAEDRRAELARMIAEARDTRRPLEEAVEEAQAVRDAVGDWNRYDAEVARRALLLAGVAESASELGLTAQPDDLSTTIEERLRELRGRLAEVTEHITDARARRRAAEHALSLLDSDDPSCPTCLRPFHGGELNETLRAQEREIEMAGRDEARWRGESDELETAIARADKLRQQVMQIPAPPPLPLRSRPEEDPQALLQRGLAALQSHDAAAGQLQHEHTILRQALEASDEARRVEQDQRTAYRREAMTRVFADALADVTTQLTQGYIEPLSEQVRFRWKALFGEEGLQLRPDGTIVRVVGDRELTWDSLSGGERIWARLVTHLLVLGASTRLPFAWFDEPLEHLDPRARRAVASALASATRTGGPKQLIVTTYEHAIARQLAADVPEASIKYIRREPTGASR